MKRLILWVGVPLVGIALTYCFVILDWSGRPFCHKQIMFAILKCTGDHAASPRSQDGVFPNVSGLSSASLAEIGDVMGDVSWAQSYMYVPGLRQTDPGDLILMYLPTPTRWAWHAVPPTIFDAKAWLVVPVDFTTGIRKTPGGGELSERISTDEFRVRLKRTMDFIRDNQRPNWQAVVAEHQKSLEAPLLQNQ